MITKETIRNKTIDVSKIWENKLIQFIINILFGISTGALTTILIESRLANEATYYILPILSFIATEIIAIKYKFLKRTFNNTNIVLLIISIILGTFFTLNNCANAEYLIFIDIIRICAILAIPSAIVFLYWFYNIVINYVKNYIKSIDKIERYYLLSTISILIVGITIIYNMTNVFYKATIQKEDYRYEVIYKNEKQEFKDYIENISIPKIYKEMTYDIIYTSDTGPLLVQDVFCNISTKQNGLRQPLFGVFTMPFCIGAKLLSTMLPNIENLYGILIAIIQGILIIVAFTLLARLMKLKGITKIIFLLSMTLVEPTLLFILNLEQYAMTFFYLILFIYLSMHNKQNKDLAYIAATGTTLTSGILFPLLGEKKKLKESIKNITYTFLKCMAIFFISARIILVFPAGIEERN